MMNRHSCQKRRGLLIHETKDNGEDLAVSEVCVLQMPHFDIESEENIACLSQKSLDVLSSQFSTLALPVPLQDFL